MVSLKEADWEYIMKEAPPEEQAEDLPPDAPLAPDAEVESVDHEQIDKLIVSRAFTRGKPLKKKHRRQSLDRNEILLASVGGVVSLLLISLLVYLIQMM